MIKKNMGTLKDIDLLEGMAKEEGEGLSYTPAEPKPTSGTTL